MERRNQPGECPVAHLALERLVPGVLPDVPRKLVRPSELPTAVFPGADVRLLSRVRPKVRFQVAGLGVALAAARVAARVRGQLPPGSTSSHDRLEVTTG